MLRITATIVAVVSLVTVPVAGRRHLSRAASIPSIDSTILKGLRWRNLGPERGGRSIAISGVKGQPKVGYFGATGGGLWKTTDGGTTWAPVTDGQLKSASVGAVAVSESNPDVIYIGMGESCIRGDIMAGDGVYKSIDAGKTWKHIGFGENQTISKIRVDPRNPDVVFVAAFGNYSTPNDERGVYKSTDGGATWRRVLFRDDKTAAIDISIDRHHPDIMYAALWQAMRNEWTMSSGGPGSGLFKSTDGGEHWQEITRNPGLPAGVIGKIGVSVSGADPNRVYAEVENENGGLFRSDDAGATWSLINSGRNIRQRAFYYTHVTADPHDKDLVYVQNVGTLRSTDGGKTMTNYAGSDSHDMWIDPDDSQHLMYANDGGGTITYDALGAHAFSSKAYSTAQLYHVVATAHVPYQVCGAQQDASTICVPTEAGGGRGGRGGGRGAAVPATYGAGGAEPGYIAPDPQDPDVFYAGGNNGSFLTRLDRRTGEEREVGPYPRMFSGEPSSALVERWQWTYPIIFSPVDPNVLYAGSQHIWKTVNGGQHWDMISPDLTRHDPKTMGPSGGPITGDMNGPEVYAVVYAIGPSKRDVNVIWAGSDDGQIHVTRNGGKSWADVTPKEMPDFGRVSIIDASAFDAGTAYAAVKRPLLNDVSPYIFRTHDFGKTWTRTTTGIPGHDYVHSVREDPLRKGLLYAATQHGVYMSYDDGDNWQSLSLNLPDVPVSDLIAESNSIAISTHGRGFYILDDVNALRQYDPALVASSDPILLAPVPAIRGAGAAQVQYWLKKPAQNVTVDFIDKAGLVVRSLSSTPAPAAGGRGQGGGRGGRGGGAAASQTPGINTVAWDLRYPSATSFPGMILWGGGTNGPVAVPGVYTVRLTVDGTVRTQPLVVQRHPLHKSATQADLEEQFALAIQIRDKVSEANNAVIEIRSLKQQVADRLAKSSDAALKAKGDALVASLSAVEQEIYQVKNQSGQDPLNFPIKINNRLASLLDVVESGDAKPIGNAAPIFRDLSAELKTQTDRLRVVRNSDVPAFNAEAKRLGLDPLSEESRP